MSGQETPRLNWDVLIQCKDCGASFFVERPDPSTEIVQTDSGPKRFVLIGIPNACPECKNIRPV